MRGFFALVLVLGGASLCLAILGGVPMPWEAPQGNLGKDAGATVAGVTK